MPHRPSEDEIRRIYRQTVDDLFAFVSRRCGGDRELAEDIRQETWLRAVKAWRTDGIPDRPVAWLCTVAGCFRPGEVPRVLLASGHDQLSARALEELNRALVFLGGGPGCERAEIASLAGPRVFLAGIEAVFA